jgi:serine phosphatase RsbU (regulator of sigma subunit)
MVEQEGFGVPIDRFRLFAANATEASVIESLALVYALDGDQREAFESAFGIPVRDLGPDGFVEAARRDRYLPVSDVFPITDQSRQLPGFDISSDPTRLAAADRSQDLATVIVSEPVAAQPSGQPAFFVVVPLLRPSAWADPVEERGDSLVGFLTTAVAGSTIVESAVPFLREGTRFAIQDGGVTLGSTDPAPAGDQTTTLEVAGREWLLTVDDGREPSYVLAWLIGVATVLLAAAIAALLWTRIRAQRREAEDANRHARSADLAQRLAEARTTTAVAEAVHQAVPSLLGASNATVRTMGDTQRVLFTVIDEQLPAPLTDAPEIPVDRANPAGRAIVDQKWVLVPDVTKVVDDYGTELVHALHDAGYASIACIPLGDTDGVAVGLLAVAWDRTNPFDDTTMALLRSITETCEQSLERSRLHDAEHLLVQQLQTTALRDPKTFAGLQLAVRYQSAMQTLTMGGDWYDTIPLDVRRVALVVGDVAGHGVPAVAEMIELRSAIHALLRAAHPLDDVLAIADGVLTADGRTRIATVLVAVFDSETHRVEYVSAGHPPPLLRDPDGAVEVLMDGRRTVLGVPPREACRIASRPFAPGCTFVAYTDGLVERRNEDLLESIDRLARRFEPAATDGERLADSILLEHAPSDAVDDDVALVIVRAT